MVFLLLVVVQEEVVLVMVVILMVQGFQTAAQAQRKTLSFLLSSVGLSGGEVVMVQL